MPIYPFRCPECKHNFEELMSWKQRSEGTVECPACKAILICKDNALLTAPAEIIMSGIFTNLNKWQKHNDKLRKKNK